MRNFELAILLIAVRLQKGISLNFGRDSEKSESQPGFWAEIVKMPPICGVSGGFQQRFAASHSGKTDTNPESHRPQPLAADFASMGKAGKAGKYRAVSKDYRLGGSPPRHILGEISRLNIPPLNRPNMKFPGQPTGNGPIPNNPLFRKGPLIPNLVLTKVELGPFRLAGVWVEGSLSLPGTNIICPFTGDVSLVGKFEVQMHPTTLGVMGFEVETGPVSAVQLVHSLRKGD